MSYPAKAIANYFVAKSIKKNDDKLNLMKLLKLIYIAHGWNLALFDKPLINEEIQAWQYGPVVESIFHAFKHYGMDLVKAPTTDLILNEKAKWVLNQYKVKFNKETKEILDTVWDGYEKNTGFDLSNWSHEPGSPWDIAWNQEKGKNYRYYPISNELIKNYFRKLGRENVNRNKATEC